MSKVRVEFLTLLSGAKALLDEGFPVEAEAAYKELWQLAKSHGNTEEKELSNSVLVKFLNTRGKTEEVALLMTKPEIQSIEISQPQESHVKDVVVIGSSAGGVEAVSILLSGLPSDFGAAVFLVQQTPGHSPSELAKMLNQRSKIPVAIPLDGDTILPGNVYLAPPNQHLIVKRGTICLGNGPKENRSRPAVDVLFRTAAHAYDSHVIGIILSGVLNDGTAGLMSIKTHGGISIVQNPDEAVFDGMPRSAIALTNVDHVLKTADIGPLLQKLIVDGIGKEGIEIMPEYKDQADVGEVGGPGIGNVAPYPPSALTCPSCGGAVWQVQEESLTLFKCHVGHSYTAELMLEEQSETVDAAAWMLLRAINESIHLRRQLAGWARSIGGIEEAEFHEQQAIEAERQSASFRSLILSNEKGRD
ncbi:MAG: chemotaxis protein CheB [Leptolyngbya sp.]|nr:chemotaxis protein CheB [Candidatus Melainabacteria bacterium]